MIWETELEGCIKLHGILSKQASPIYLLFFSSPLPSSEGIQGTCLSVCLNPVYHLYNELLAY